ncbi:right-handed parallel beta-helix repeat-containing protein [Microbacterium caowuchunii]|uniref:right-handed parallel beta-helix repeat-containing protein n=1 Tax=Microbacterium caowuchunii TaxID=2614638 RepID=UPI00177DC890|nr:right-handed parallel beta-helix repeat-containing protein [Microbacterium caowuchunii]
MTPPLRHGGATSLRAPRATAAGLVALLALLVAGCTPAAPAPTPCTPGAEVVGPTTQDLQRALDDARPGDVLQLGETTYRGNIVITASGTDPQPITVCGSAGSTLDGGDTGGGYALHLDGASNWVLTGFAVRGGAKGIVLDNASHNDLRGLEVSNTGEEAIHLRAGSSDNTIRDSSIRDTGRNDAEIGEGIYIGSAQSNWCRYTDCAPDASDRNTITGTTITTTTAEAIDVKEGTTGTVIRGNTLAIAHDATVDSVVDLKGDDIVFERNRLTVGTGTGVQVHNIVDDWGAGIRIRNNTFTADHDRVLIEVVGRARGLGTVVGCDNVRDSGGTARSTMACI